MSDFTSIQVTKDLKEQLGKIKDANNYKSYQEAIEQLIEGNVSAKEYEVIHRDPIALTLECVELDETGNGYLYDKKEISYQELKNAQNGDIFAPQLSETEFFMFQNATVVYMDNSFVLLKIHEVLKTPNEYKSFNELLGVDLF